MVREANNLKLHSAQQVADALREVNQLPKAGGGENLHQPSQPIPRTSTQSLSLNEVVIAANGDVFALDELESLDKPIVINASEEERLAKLLPAGKGLLNVEVDESSLNLLYAATLRDLQSGKTFASAEENSGRARITMSADDKNTQGPIAGTGDGNGSEEITPGHARPGNDNGLTPGSGDGDGGGGPGDSFQAQDIEVIQPTPSSSSKTSSSEKGDTTTGSASKKAEAFQKKTMFGLLGGALGGLFVATISHFKEDQMGPIGTITKHLGIGILALCGAGLTATTLGRVDNPEENAAHLRIDEDPVGEIEENDATDEDTNGSSDNGGSETSKRAA